MRNPFKEVGKTIGGMWTDAAHSDCTTPGLNRTGVVLATPVVAPFVFIAALFRKPEQQP